jgi:hypothetical protein
MIAINSIKAMNAIQCSKDASIIAAKIIAEIVLVLS